MNFSRCLAFTLRWEGGYVNDWRDPGKATNFGITQRVYTAWLAEHGFANEPVRKIEDAHVTAIYRVEYWNDVNGDNLPWPVDLAVFDYAVNSNPSRATRALQRLVDTPQDGDIGPGTLRMVAMHDPYSLAHLLCDQREEFMRTTKSKKGFLLFPFFGKGWLNRVNALRKEIDKP